MSRKRIPIDWKKVDQLLEAGSDGTQVAAYIGINEETLYRRVEEEFGIGFAVYKAQKRAKGDTLLLTKQFQVAMSGDKTMLVWLGKQRLKQTDKAEVDHTSKGEKIDTNVTVNTLHGTELDDKLRELISKRD